MEGALASGRFEVLHLLGEGGMGVVHAARDLESGEVVALKRLRFLGGDELLRFKQEFRGLQDIRHPNLAVLRELVEEAGTWMFTMELVDGVDLLAWVGDPPGDAARIRAALVQLAAGLGALHAAGKVHRDIKPSNVLVTADGRLVLVDFGMVTDFAQRDTLVVGTAAYMAPEQAGSRPIGPAADWYAVGCLLYEALTGQLPFDGSAIEVLSRKLQVEPPAPSTLATIPADLDQLCVDLLRIDPDDRPDAEEVGRRLSGLEARPSRAMPALAPAFVGRAAELATLDAAFAEAADGPVAVLIHGESGVGKSTLVRQFLARLQTRGAGAAVLAGRCYERESVRYKAVDGVIDSLSRFLGRLPAGEVTALAPAHTDVLLKIFPVLGRVEALVRVVHGHDARDPGERRQRLMRALRELFVRLARRGRVVVSIDDLQWADADGLAVLRELLRTPGGPPLLLIATARDATRAHDLPARPLHLGPLDDLASRELAGALARAAGIEDVVALDRIATESGGHPLFVDELIRHAADHGAPHVGLADAIAARIARQPEPARLLLELLAVARAPVRHGTLARALELDLPAVGRNLDVLRAAHLVRTSGARRADTAETFHDQIAAAATRAITPEVRRHRHAQLARGLADEADLDAEALAIHWSAAGDDARAAIHARSAADRAATDLAFDKAARLYLRVLELGAGVDDVELYGRLGDALAGAGRSAEAAGAYLSASALAAPQAAHRFEALVADQLLLSGRIEEGVRRSERALARVGLSYPATPRRALLSLLFSRARVRLRGLGFRPRTEAELAPEELERIDLCWSISTGLRVVDVVRGADFQARHLLLALKAGEPRRIARGLVVEAGFSASAGVGAEPRVTQLIARALELATRHDDVYVRAFARAVSAVTSFLFGRWREAYTRALDAETELRERCVGAHWEIATTHLFWVWAGIQLGELAAVEARLPQLVAEANARGDLLSATQLVVGHASVLALAADDPDRLRREQKETIARWTGTQFQLPHCFHVWAMTQADLYEGDGAAAHARLTEAWPRIDESQIMRVEFIRIILEYLRGRVACAVGDEASLRVAEDAAARLEREDPPYAAPMAAAIGAGLAGLRGDQPERARLLDEAATGFDAVEMYLHAAAARWHRGHALGGTDGARLASEAEAWFHAHTVRAPQRMARMLVP